MRTDKESEGHRDLQKADNFIPTLLEIFNHIVTSIILRNKTDLICKRVHSPLSFGDIQKYKFE